MNEIIFPKQPSSSVYATFMRVLSKTLGLTLLVPSILNWINSSLICVNGIIFFKHTSSSVYATFMRVIAKTGNLNQINFQQVPSLIYF